MTPAPPRATTPPRDARSTRTGAADPRAGTAADRAVAPGAAHAVVPAPVHVEQRGAGPLLGRDVEVRADPALADALPLLTDVLVRRLGRRLHVVEGVTRASGPGGAAPGPDAHVTPPATGQAVVEPVVVELVLDDSLPEEAYALETSPAGVVVRAAGAAGARHAVQTLRQLVGPAAFREAPVDDVPLPVPGVRIEDAPRFGYRGVLLDVARHHLPKREVMRFVDLAAAHKLSTVHLHLTDDQGWRVEIRAYPLLTQVGGWRHESQVGSSHSPHVDGRPHGGWYTQDDLREIVAFARTRGVTVVPEIDVPGHSQAAMAAYPQLATGTPPQEVWTRWGLSPHVLAPTEAVLDFYRTVLDEVVGIFDSPVVCLGGDEVRLGTWADDPTARLRVEELGLGDVDELLSWFVGQLAEHLRGHGRRTSVWDEVGGSRAPRDVVVNSWRGVRSALDALRDGHDVVVATEHEVYLDHRAAPGLDEPVPVGTVRTLEDVYGFDPVGPSIAEAVAEEGAGRVLGAQAQVWTEQLDSPQRVDYATFPRLCAFAEAVWSPVGARDWVSFETRLTGAHLARLDAAGVEHRPLRGPHPWQRRPGVPGWPLRVDALGQVVHAPTGDR